MDCRLISNWNTTRAFRSAGPETCASPKAQNATVADGHNRVLQNLLFPPIDGQAPAKIRRCAIVVTVRVLSAQVHPKLSREEREKRGREIIQKALEGLPDSEAVGAQR
jgi:hypothetical protein